MSDSYAPEMAGPPSNPSSAVLPWLAGLVAPHIRDYLTKPAPAQGPLPAYGKTPEDHNPNAAGAIGDAANIASAFLPLGAAGRAARAVESFAPSVVPRAGGVMPEAPNMLRMIGGVAGSVDPTSPAEAAPRLSRQEQHDLLMQRQQEEQRQEMASRAAATKQQQDLAAQEAEDRRRQMNMKAETEAHMAAEQQRAEMERQRAAADQAAAAQREREMNERPFREKYPAVATALPIAGMAASTALPFAKNAMNAGRANKLLREWEGTAGRTEQAVISGDKEGARLGANQLKGYQKNWPAAEKKVNQGYGLGGQVASGFLPAEATMFPSEYDYATQPHDSAAYKSAHDLFTNPAELAQRAGMAWMGGTGMAGVGNKIPFSTRLPPLGRSQGAVAAVKAQSATRKKAPAYAPRKPGEDEN